jgi:site-specific DNA recombinase
MNNAIIYTRVSTDEQAQRGYSLDHQLNVLTHYCQFSGYKIIMRYTEDYSAKDFNRPEWNKLMQFVELNKRKVDLILVSRWDRFSRNQEESLKVIRRLNSLGISVNAAEQPLDLSNPDNKVLFAFYLILPEVENDKIRIRTTEGMREAKRQGFWMGSPPFGYKSARTDDQKSTIEPNSKAILVKEAFELISTGFYTCEEVRRKINDLGAKMVKQSFINMLNNIAYTGRIYLPSWKKEEAQIVLGIHKPIISVDLFKQVQDVLSRRKRQPPKHNKRSEFLPLRGFLICESCGSVLTGSGSTGRNGLKHFYYHCQRKCPTRFRADNANEMFLKYLSSFTISNPVKELFLSIMQAIYRQGEGDKIASIKGIESEILKIRDRIENIQDKLADNLIDIHEYNSIIKRFESQISDLDVELYELKITDKNFIKYIEFSLKLIERMDYFYGMASVDLKQKILVSMFPGKLIYDGKKYRTTKLNEVFAAITRKDNKDRIGEKEKVGKFTDLSTEAPQPGLEPGTY